VYVLVVGRAAACTQLDQLLGLARQGQSGALAIVGEAGIGKTTLLNYAIDAASGMRVLHTRGAELETGIPYAGLSELLGPALGLLDELPEPQAAALSAAFALGPPVGGDRFPVGAATLGLLVATAAAAPVLVAVDDAQWLDEASAVALFFALRRLRADPVLFLLAFRVGHGTRKPPPDLPVLTVGGLDETAASALLAGQGHLVDPEMLPWLVRATGGNPLALLELPKLLSPTDFMSYALRAEPVPVGPVLEAAYGRSVTTLPITTRRALLVAALLDGADVAILEQALRATHLDLQALAPAEDAALVATPPGAVVFRHPLVKSVIHQTATPSECRAAHRAIARALEGSSRPYDKESRAWHLAAATIGVDEAVAKLLEECGDTAVARGVYHVACLAYERAAQLTADPARRSTRLLAGSASALTAGLPDKTSELLERAAEAAGDTRSESTAAIRLRGRLETWSGAPLAALQRLESEAIRLRPIDAALALELLRDAMVAALFAGEIQRASQMSDLVAEISADADPGTAVLGDQLIGGVQALRGDGQRATLLLDRVRQVLEVPNPPAQLLELLIYLAAAYSFIDRFDEAVELFNQAIKGARYHGAIGLLPFALTQAAVIDFRTGAWEAAYATASEALRLAEDTKRTTDLANAVVVLSLIEAGQGKEEAREHAQIAIESAAAMGASSVEAQGYSMLGLLELGLGRPEAAIPHLRHCGDMAQRLGLLELGHLQWAPELVEALTRTGAAHEAVSPMQVMVDRAHSASGPLVQALTARCQGLLAGDAGFESYFTIALRMHAHGARPFETARTQLGMENLHGAGSAKLG
jgi:tetratricopeptide (TPR) repeat protein